MRVIMDGVFNHTGRETFFAFADLRVRQGALPYQDWYLASRLTLGPAKE